MKKGMIIAIEGADKAGKHTQTMNIVNYLRSLNIHTETLDFPQYNSFFGRMVKDYLNGNFGSVRDLPAEYTMLPYALDRQQHQPFIRQCIESGKWLVLDRYTYSNSFSIAKLPKEQWQEKISFMEDLEFNQLGIIKPDYNIYLYLDPKIAFNMRNQGLKQYQNGKADIHESDYKLLKDVSEVYKTIAKQNPQTWTVIDEMKPDGQRMTIKEVFSVLRPVVDNLLNRSR